jgi:purine-binding chemotaxis protein CheW
MTAAAPRTIKQAAALRHNFDRSFAEPAMAPTVVFENMLGIAMGGQAFALRLSEIAGLFGDKRIVPVPGGITALLGVAAFRGAILPVYDLRKLLNAADGGDEPPNWLVVAAAEAVAFAFDTFHGQFRVSPDAIASRDPQAAAGNHMRGIVRSESLLRPIIDLQSVLDAVKTTIAG